MYGELKQFIQKFREIDKVLYELFGQLTKLFEFLAHHTELFETLTNLTKFSMYFTGLSRLSIELFKLSIHLTQLFELLIELFDFSMYLIKFQGCLAELFDFSPSYLDISLTWRHNTCLVDLMGQGGDTLFVTKQS